MTTSHHPFATSLARAEKALFDGLGVNAGLSRGANPET